MYRVKKISWISKDALEAIVLVSDNKYAFECFSQPCKLSLNQKIEENIYCFNNKNIIKVSEKECIINKHYKSLAYDIVGCIVDKDEGLVKIGNIIIKLEENSIPKDIENYDYISFYTQRLDIY
ncbi:MAG: hypothetical protein KIB43_03020 [Clostridium baratii]|uniref:hypothetical protein n=1 Tax=Clostridium baratii TaxID=1561 RepID=UPI00242B4EB5|nr:hypothetical protein [Clostridium baratii]MBS6005907.1 hypothetical protein [Clostridium baratii]MDU1052973.1 hypothetical protein [Clostridium baratii]